MKIKSKSTKSILPKQKTKKDKLKTKKKERKSRKSKRKPDKTPRSRSNSRDQSKEQNEQPKKKKTKKKIKDKNKKKPEPPKQQAVDDASDTPRRQNSVSSKDSALPPRPWYKKKRSKKDPIVYACCGFCSLGAGSLLTGLIYLGLCIGYTVFRVGDFREHVGKKMVIWSSATGIFMNIWRVMLIVGMGTAALNMLGALVLLVASCIWGQKEHYIRMRNAAIIWVSTTTVALVYNLGEAVYVSVIPYKVPIPPIEGDEYNLLSRGNHHHYSKIKKNMATVWGLTGTHLFFYIYLIIVVISYLRLLKYKGAPKVGKDMAGSDSEEEVVGVLQRSKNSSFSQQSMRSRTSDRQSEQSFASSNDLSRSSYTNPAFLPNNTYINWPKNDDDTKSDITNLPTRATPIDSRSATSSVYDLPPEDIYDETAESPSTKQEDDSKLKEKATKFEADLSQRAEAALKLSDSVLNAMGKMETKPSTVTSSTTASVTSSINPPILKKPTIQRRNSFDSQPLKPMSRKPMQPLKPAPKKEEPTKPTIQPEVVSKFFNRLDSGNHHLNPGNPMEEMFRIFGSSLCEQHPENCERYLKSYKDIHSRGSHLTSLQDPFELEPVRSLPMMPQPQQFPLLADDIYHDRFGLYGHNDGYPRHHNEPQRRPNDFPQRHIELPRRHMEPPRRHNDLPQRHNDLPPRHNDLPPRHNDLPPRHIDYPRHPNEPPRRHNDFSRRHNDQYSRHQPSHFTRPEPTYGFRPHSRVIEDRHPMPALNRAPERPFYPDHIQPYHMHYPYTPQGSAYTYDDSIYYDSSCSLCDYGSIYGDYGSYYSDYYPPNQPHTPPPRYTGQTPNDTRRQSTTSTLPTWIPLQEESYTVYPPLANNFKRSKSLPNIHGPLKGRTESRLSEGRNRTPASPSFVVPSPREATRVSRSSSFADDDKPPVNDRRVGNYSGYHTGDLRSKTSHTSDGSKAFNLARSKSFSNRTRRASFNIGDEDYEKLGSVYSTFNLMSAPGGRPPMRPATSRSSSRRPSGDFPSRSPRLPPRSPVIPPRLPSFRGPDPYPDKHIGKDRPNSILRSESSLDGTKAVVPFKRRHPVNEFKRSKSFRFSEHQSDKELKTKQVKFGSTPNLHHI